jgi:hypothetical protein
MSGFWTYVTIVYVAGVALGLIVIDAQRPGVRIGLALLWPLGPLAFVVTLGVLVAAAMIAFPAFGAVVIAGAVAWWALFGLRI